MNQKNFYGRIWMPAVKQAGIEWVTWHDLRHTFASRLAMSGATEHTIATLLRHNGTTLVKRYAHLSPSYLQEAVEGVSSFGKPANTGQCTPKKDPLSIPTVTGTGIVGDQEQVEVL